MRDGYHKQVARFPEGDTLIHANIQKYLLNETRLQEGEYGHIKYSGSNHRQRMLLRGPQRDFVSL